MHIQIVMDHTGDTQHHFDPNDDLAVAESRRRFQALTDSGYTAAKRTGKGSPCVVSRATPPIVMPPVRHQAIQEVFLGRPYALPGGLP
jgi:hypothetical protein